VPTADPTAPTTSTPLRVERGTKRVRAYLGGQLVVDTELPLLVWEVPYYPAYHLPLADVVADLVPSEGEVQLRSGHDASAVDIEVPGARAAGAGMIVTDPDAPTLHDHVRFEWAAMDAWFEEDEEVIVHPRDPYKRIDALRSTRHVVVEVADTVVADTRAAVVLYETGLIPRRYLPPTDVRRDLLVASDTVTHCPYKGTTRYWHLQVGEHRVEDAVWSYPSPLPESLAIAGLLCIDETKVDLTVDGRRRPRPSSPVMPDPRVA
jgi:uncharacterized protein (DUF427 family)